MTATRGGTGADGSNSDRSSNGSYESHWECWRLQTLETRMEPWEATINEEARSRGATHLRRRHKLSAWCERSEMNSAPLEERFSGWRINSAMALRASRPGWPKPILTMGSSGVSRQPTSSASRSLSKRTRSSGEPMRF